MVNEQEIKRVACYFRYSSSKEMQVENSEKRQREMLERLCSERGFTIEWIGGDQKTKGAKDKPQLMRLKKLVEQKLIRIDTVIVTAWDRLTRKNLVNFADDVKFLHDAGIKILLSQENRVYDLRKADDGLHLGMRVYEASRFLETHSSNVRSGLVSKWRQGKLGYARSPFGFSKGGPDGKDLIPNEDLKLVPEIFRVALEKGVIAAVPVMRQGNRYQKKGKVPSTGAVKFVLRNPIYTGWRTFGVVGAGEHGTIRGSKTKTTRNVNRLVASPLEPIDVREQITPVVTMDLFQAVQTMLDSNQNKPPKRSGSKYRYSGRLRCSCGAKLIAEKKKTHVNYVCPRSKNLKGGCEADFLGRKTIPQSAVDFFVSDWVRNALCNKKFHVGMVNGAIDFCRHYLVKSKNEGLDLLERIERKKAKRKQLVAYFGATDEANWGDIRPELESLEKEIRQLEKKLQPDDAVILDLLSCNASGAVGRNEQYIAEVFQIARQYVQGAVSKMEIDTFIEEKIKSIREGWPTKTELRQNGKKLQRNFELFCELVPEVQIHWMKTPPEFLDRNPQFPKSMPKSFRANYSVDCLFSERPSHSAPNRGGLSSKSILIAFYPALGKRRFRWFVTIQNDKDED